MFAKIVLTLLLIISIISCKSTKKFSNENKGSNVLKLVDSSNYSGYILYDNKLKKGWFKKGINKSKIDSASLVKEIIIKHDFKLLLDSQLKKYPKAFRIGLDLCLSDKRFIIDRKQLYKRKYKLITVEDFKFYIYESSSKKKLYSFCNNKGLRF
jgi:hypothetical protein